MNILNTITNAFTTLVDNFYIREIRKDPANIYTISNPSEKVILALVDQAPELIPYVVANHADKLTSEVKIAMIQKNPNAIMSFHVSDGLLLDVLKNHGDRLSEEAKLSIVEQKPFFIGDIKNPSEKVQLAAIREDASVVRLIKNPFESVQLAAVSSDAYNILKIEQPSIKVCMAAIKKELGITNISNKNLIDATKTLFSNRVEISNRCGAMYQQASYSDDLDVKKREFAQADSWKEEQFLKTFHEFENAVGFENSEMPGCEKIDKAHNERIKLVVYNEYALGYIFPETPDTVNALHASILKGAPFRLGCNQYYIRDIDTVRLASRKDFDDFGVDFKGYGDPETYEFKDIDKVDKRIFSPLDKEFRDALEGGDYTRLSQLKDSGYLPTKEVIQSLSASLPERSSVAVQKIFGLNLSEGLRPEAEKLQNWGSDHPGSDLSIDCKKDLSIGL